MFDDLFKKGKNRKRNVNALFGKKGFLQKYNNQRRHHKENFSNQETVKYVAGYAVSSWYKFCIFSNPFVSIEIFSYLSVPDRILSWNIQNFIHFLASHSCIFVLSSTSSCSPKSYRISFMSLCSSVLPSEPYLVDWHSCLSIFSYSLEPVRTCRICQIFSHCISIVPRFLVRLFVSFRLFPYLLVRCTWSFVSFGSYRVFSYLLAPHLSLSATLVPPNTAIGSFHVFQYLLVPYTWSFIYFRIYPYRNHVLPCLVVPPRTAFESFHNSRSSKYLIWILQYLSEPPPTAFGSFRIFPYLLVPYTWLFVSFRTSSYRIHVLPLLSVPFSTPIESPVSFHAFSYPFVPIRPFIRRILRFP